jgi:hypothetical protein
LATIALGADPGLRGLPFGVPPAPDDAVIAHVAPPQCLFYVNWAGTASPDASCSRETEKLLAEPEVQDLFRAINKLYVDCLRKQDDDSNAAAITALPGPAGALPPTATCQPGLPVQLPTPGATTAPPQGSDKVISPRPASGLVAAQPSAAQAPEKPRFSITAQDGGDWFSVLLTHPTAIFIADVKGLPRLAQEAASARVANYAGCSATTPACTPSNASPVKSLGKPVEMKEPGAIAAPDIEVHAGMVVSLGSDTARLHAKFVKYLKRAKNAGLSSHIERVKIDDKTWYRTRPSQPGDKNLVTFGFHGKYFVIGVGEGVVEGILARWDRPAPAWLTKAMEQTQVPRRAGIVYLNLHLLRDTLLPLVPSKTEVVAMLEILGLNNVDALISTTGLEDYGMINRVLLAVKGKPRGLLDMVAGRPLAIKDLEPIPSDALLAVAARIDLQRVFKLATAACETAGAAGNPDLQKAIEDFKKESGVDMNRFLSSIGDRWCVYNSPSEGEIAFLGWTAVVSVRDRTTLIDAWEKLCAAQEKTAGAKMDAKNIADKEPGKDANTTQLEFRKCRCAGHDVYYVAGAAIAPAFYISDREMVMTLNMPAMKAYLARKNHCSLATLSGIELALSDRNQPVALGYCDTPRLFDFLYPFVSLYGSAMAGWAHEAKLDLDPTFWPSASAIRPHLRPDITSLQRTPYGLQLTCRYCLPTGGVNAPLWLIGSSTLGGLLNGWEIASAVPSLPGAFPAYSSPQVNGYQPTQIGSDLALPTAQSPVAPGVQANVPYGATANVLPTPATTSPANSYGAVAASSSSYPSNTCPPAALPSGPANSTASPYSSYPAAAYSGYGNAATSYNATVTPPGSSSNQQGNAYGTSAAASPYASCPAGPYFANNDVPVGSRTSSNQLQAAIATNTAPTAKVPKHKVTTADVVALMRADVDEVMIIAHILSHGVAAPVQAAEAASLQQQGVSQKVIEVLQQQSTAAAAAAPTPGLR